jgi:hypothetical protein
MIKRGLLLSLGIILLAGLAYGQAGFIGLYSDFGYTNCSMVDTPGEVSIYVVHKASAGATSSQFRIAVGAGMACTPLEVIHNFTTTIGDPATGITVSYGACYPSDILLFTWVFSCSGSSAPCSILEVVPDPAAVSGTIEIFDCSHFKLVGGGGIMYVNPDGSCDCGEVVPEKDTSWGQIKSLYQ